MFLAQGARDPRHVGKVVSRIGDEAEVYVTSSGKPASAHDLRRSFGQRLADSGVLLRDLQALMRHADFRTTEKYYLKDRAADQAARIASVLVKTGHTPGHISESSPRADDNGQDTDSTQSVDT